MLLTTPESIRTHRGSCMPRPSKNRPTTTQGGGLALGACLGMKNIGMPCAGEPHARFDEGGQACACPLLYLGIPTISIADSVFMHSLTEGGASDATRPRRPN